MELGATIPMESPYAAPSAPAKPAPAPVAVVSPQFCAPSVVPLTVTKKSMSFSGGDFTFTDANGTVVLQVNGTVFSVRRRSVLHDAAGQPILTMQAKAVTMHNTWKVFRGDSTAAHDLLFTLKRSSVFQLRTKMDVFLAGNTTEDLCDFRIKGCYSQRSCAFYRGNSNIMIAEMKRKFTLPNVLLGKHTLSVTVFPHVDHVFIAALVVIMREIHKVRRKVGV